MEWNREKRRRKRRRKERQEDEKEDEDEWETRRGEEGWGIEDQTKKRWEEKRRAWKDDKAEEKKADNRKELPLMGIEGGLETDDKVKERERD